MLHHACGQQGAIDAERGRVNDDETLGHSGQKTLLTDQADYKPTLCSVREDRQSRPYPCPCHLPSRSMSYV